MTTATGNKTTGGTTTATRGTTTGDTMTATGGTAMQHNDGDVQHDNSDGRLIAIHRYCVEVVTIDRGCIDFKKKKKTQFFF